MSDELKRQAALRALAEIRDGMIVGLGTGSTAAHFIRELGGARLKVAGIPTSEESRRLAEEAGIRLTTFKEHPRIDVTVDGADEVSPELDLIKGLGGALVREKIVAHASKRVVIIVDESKLVDRLGQKAVIPIEVIPLAVPCVLLLVQQLRGEARVRERDGLPFVSDNGNSIVDWNHGIIDDPTTLEKQLKAMTGVVDSGIFANVAHCAIVAGGQGIRKLERA
ncbi:MAG: ribose 5-phosphate isomerase A [Acidobacteria bacterium]|nr:MAG: ribose 5-phosphate isomerase A [Acidobacteriota bacterium]